MQPGFCHVGNKTTAPVVFCENRTVCPDPIKLAAILSLKYVSLRDVKPIAPLQNVI